MKIPSGVWGAVLGCSLLVLFGVPVSAESQAQKVSLSQQQPQTLTLEGPAIHMLVTLPLRDREIRKLVTDARTAREHPDLAAYYRSESQRLQAESDKYERFARAAGDTTPLEAPNHYNIGRSARFDYLAAKDSLRRAQEYKLQAALYHQAAQRQGCFMCHSLNGQGGTVAPDLAKEGARGRSSAWLIGHFKDPQAHTAGSVMPAFGSLSDHQLRVLTTYLQNQKGK
jgi:mono/diheme cytochrome c family protein